ncbi:hypothetical protein B0H11DRAFT_1918070 [Mycena galericulata]|nr:hypothetical protein B0H11DRAFT_1918070 [Mycena galericulata]
MAGVINLSTDRRFDPSKWIAVGKIYKDVPEEVSDAYSAARQLPSALAATLPLPDLSVTEFLALKRPGILRRPGLARIYRIATLLLLSIPPENLLRDLEHDFPQKWLNGARSILDPLNDSLRLPLFALSFYGKIHKLREAQVKWTTSMEWARDELPGCNLAIFASVFWNKVHPEAHIPQVRWQNRTTRPGLAAPSSLRYKSGPFGTNSKTTHQRQLKEGIQQSKGLRNDTVFQKARYRRWIVSGPAVEWKEGCRLDVALADLRGKS